VVSGLSCFSLPAFLYRHLFLPSLYTILIARFARGWQRVDEKKNVYKTNLCEEARARSSRAAESRPALAAPHPRHLALERRSWRGRRAARSSRGVEVGADDLGSSAGLSSTCRFPLSAAPQTLVCRRREGRRGRACAGRLGRGALRRRRFALPRGAVQARNLAHSAGRPPRALYLGLRVGREVHLSVVERSIERLPGETARARAKSIAGRWVWRRIGLRLAARDMRRPEGAPPDGGKEGKPAAGEPNRIKAKPTSDLSPKPRAEAVGA